jgi:hypothetical protein
MIDRLVSAAHAFEVLAKGESQPERQRIARELLSILINSEAIAVADESEQQR